MAWEVGNLPAGIEPNLENGIPSVHEPVPPRTTGPDTNDRGTRTTTDPQRQDHHGARDENQHGERDHDNAGSGNENNGG